MAKQTRQTRQKEMLESETRNMDGLFTPEDLLCKAQAKNKDIGIATVYRFLKMKAARDELHSYYCERRQVYATQGNSHSHFTCSRCGRTEHLSIKDISFLKRQLDGKICHFQIDIHGICSKCANRKQS
jgi:Fur family transcriptional regulator, ferric uptake regulator